jgi:predicted dehydrogenase
MSNLQPIRLGMVGGGEGAFIGAVHRIAARMDGHFVLVAGALSANAAKAKRSALALGLDPARSYADYAQMARAEKQRADGIQAVAIATPNHLHAPVAKAFLAAGIHVICDKPLTATLAEARSLALAAKRAKCIFALTHNYTGYPMVRHARQMIAEGELGQIRVVQVEYAQDWLATNLERSGHKQAAWRTDPKQAGPGGALGDIGTHAFNLAAYVSGLTLDRLSADLSQFVAGRRLDDDARILLRYKGGARGMLWASQVASGSENALKLRIYGTKAGIEWQQEHPNQLAVAPLGEPRRVLSRGTAAANKSAARVTRIPAGHPEGYLEAFANLYSEIAGAIRSHAAGTKADPAAHFPGIADGVDGMRFIAAAIASSRAGGRWRPL